MGCQFQKRITRGREWREVTENLRCFHGTNVVLLFKLKGKAYLGDGPRTLKNTLTIEARKARWGEMKRDKEGKRKSIEQRGRGR